MFNLNFKIIDNFFIFFYRCVDYIKGGILYNKSYDPEFLIDEHEVCKCGPNRNCSKNICINARNSEVCWYDPTQIHCKTNCSFFNNIEHCNNEFRPICSSKLYVKCNTTNKYGLFTYQTIGSHVYIDESVGLHIKNIPLNEEYIFQINANTILDAEIYGNLTRFIRHSNDIQIINCEIYIVSVCKVSRMCIRTIREVKSNEELIIRNNI